MSVFNYSDHRQDRLNNLLDIVWGKEVIKTAMAYTQMQFRDQYQWWDLEEILREPPESYVRELEIVPSLKGVVLDARKERKSKIAQISEEQNIPVATAARMVKTYVGFHPAYGAYCCQLGPYASKGFWWGGGYVVEQAKGRFGYFVKRYARATPEEIGGSLLKNIDKYREAYNVDLDPGDFQLQIKQPVENQPVGAGKTKMEQVMEPINMDPNNARFRRIFNIDAPAYEPCPECKSTEITVAPGQQEVKRGTCNACGAEFDAQPTSKGLGPMLPGDAAWIRPNTAGYEKILRGFFEKYYTDTLKEVADKNRTTPARIITQMLTDLKVLDSVYSIALDKYQTALAKGEVANIGQVPPPKFLDKTLALRPGVGAITFTKVPRPLEMRNQFNVMREVADHLYGNLDAIPPVQPTDDLNEIASRLNAEPSRVKSNEDRRRANIVRVRKGQTPLPISNFTADAVQMYVDMIEVQKEKIGEGVNKQSVLTSIDDLEKNLFSINPETGEIKTDDNGKPVDAYGFDDLKTTYYMTKLFFSSVPRDKKTKAHVGVPNATSFDPSPNMENFTTQDLAAARAGAPLTKEQREADPAALEKEIGQLPDVGKQLVVPKGEEVPLAEGENPLAEMEPVPEELLPPDEDTEQKRRERLEDIIGTTVKNLIKIASELDENGKESAAEEIHKIIRKYQARVF